MNFEYLKAFPDLKKLYEYCAEAEEFAIYKPNISATAARKAVEYIVKMIYIAKVGDDYGLSVYEMMTDERFKDYVNDPVVINTMHYIRKMGNVGVHEGNVTHEEALKVLEQLHFLVGEFCILLGLTDDYPEFIAPTETVAPPPTKEQEQKASDEPKKVTVEPEVSAKFTPRMRQVRFNVKYERDEDENRMLYMSACLREAGWPIVTKSDVAMPCSAGVGIVLDSSTKADYVLYGRDNKPLAIIEYALMSQTPMEARHAAQDKADKMQVKYGHKPIIYYMVGYNIYIIDQLGYKPRRVFQFHTLEELELMNLRRTMRQDITNPAIDDNITNRYYQKEAIRATCAAFSDKRRRSLLVMATGTGKTRVSISLVDVLMKAGWIKNVLFLADRTSLVRQAHKNFNKLLPSVTTSIYSGGSDRDPAARIIFSTYQTMINLISDDSREFSIGRFDLIIIDEAHRSIFKKYSALFNYFDSLMIGLTATPRSEENKSTYRMFDLKDGKPDYAYELEKAIKDGYLVGFEIQDKTTDALRRGVHYDELSDDEKRKFEDTFTLGGEEGEKQDFAGTVIDPATIKKTRYINLGTIDAMLNDLMRNGLKINGGDMIGKTIIFSKSHLEAEKIVERFGHIYPYLDPDFCKLIDSQIINNLSLIDNFGERGKLPQIAVSVDMMDTGIDVPDVLNLVFFKQVQSKIKFLQMVGRGTRLSPDIYGPGMNKTGFRIFDYYGSCDFFRAYNTWSVVNDERGDKSYDTTPQSVNINLQRLGILRTLIENGATSPFEIKYRDELKNYFISAVRGLCNDDIEVQYNMPYVSKYRTAEMWDGFTDGKIEEISEHILPLLPPERDNVKVKNFDLMIYVIENQVPLRAEADKDIRKIRHGFGNIGNEIDAMMVELLKLKTIPAVVEKEDLINEMRHADMLFDDFSLEKCEFVRKQLRDLMAYIPDNKIFYILDAKDFVIDVKSGGTPAQEKPYAERAMEYIAVGSPALTKLRNLDTLSQDDKDELENVFKSKLGSEADYSAWSGNKPLLPFLRVQTGISDEAIETKFGSFMNPQVLNGQQLAYMEQIIEYVRENGDIAVLDLQRVSPFCDVDVVNLFGANIKHVKALIKGLNSPVS